MYLAIALIAVFVLLAAQAVSEASSLPLWAEDPVWPIPREAEYGDDRLLLTDAAIVVPDGDEKHGLPGRLLSEMIADEFVVSIPVVAGSCPEGKTPIIVGAVTDDLIAQTAAGRVTREDPGAEGYVVEIDSSGALVAGSDHSGTLYGVSTFLQLVHKWGKQSVAVRKAHIRDWPFLPVRWVHVYIPGREDLPFFRRYMRDFLLRWKFNGMIMEVGAGMRLDAHGEINTGWQRTVEEWYAYGESIHKYGEGCPLGPGNRFGNSCHPGVGGGGCIEKDDFRRLVEAAAGYGLEIVPEIQSLAHVYYMACAHREIAETPEDDWPNSYCPSNPETYKLLFEIMDEYIDVIKPARVHIGHDEWRDEATCARCAGKDTGELFAQDVLKIHKYLKAKGIETWMWGDHFVDSHNRPGRKWSEGSVVRYETPQTLAARDIVAEATGDIRITNWSGERGDETFKKLGWKFILGNFRGTGEADWPARVERGGCLGGEVSSWCAADEFQLAKLNLTEALYTANLLWSSHYPEKDVGLRRVAETMPGVRGRLSASPPPSTAATPMRFEIVNIDSACNHPPKGGNWDLSGVVVGRAYRNGIPYRIVDAQANGGLSCVLVSRLAREEEPPREVDLGVSGRWASLVFIQSATEPGRKTVHPGDQTHMPHESGELLGHYEIRFADGLVAVHAIRYEETVSAWDCGFSVRPYLTYYFTRALAAGKLPDGREVVLWASEWTNPRVDVPILSVKLVAAPAPTNSCPILFGITAVEKPRVEDYR